MSGGERRRQPPRREFPIPGAGEWPKPQDPFNLQDVLAASLLSCGVLAEVRRIEAQLRSAEGAERSGWLLTLLKYPPWKAQIAKPERDAKTVRSAAAPIDEREILSAQWVVAHPPSFLGHGSVETEPVRCGEQFSVWPGCPC